MEFERLKILVGDNFSAIKNLSILVLGVGGVGGYAVEGLARSGVSKLTLVDYDTIDITNINRQIIAMHSTLGMKKIEVLKQRILDINPRCQVDTFDIFYNEDNQDLIFNKKYDYVLDCCDNLKAKEIIIRKCILKNIKIISSMGAGYKIDPTKIKITKLKKTDYDKLAKNLRFNLKDNKECLEIPVVYSTEQFSKTTKVIGSNSYIPSIFGLYMVSFVINDCLENNR